MFFTLARRYLPQSMREARRCGMSMDERPCMFAKLLCVGYKFPSSLSNLLHFPDPLRPYCAEEAAVTETPSRFPLFLRAFSATTDSFTIP